jgi:hypothetical protein
MTLSPDHHPLEDYPRGELPANVSRRQLFTLVSDFFQAAQSEGKGEAVLNLAGLGSLPDEALGGLIPAIVPDCQITVKEDAVWGQPPGRKVALRLFAIDPLALAAFNLVNGMNSLADMADELERVQRLPQSRAFALARGMVLTLVQAGVCLPTNTSA